MNCGEKDGKGIWAGRIKDELLAEATQRPTRVELERRRLLARIRNEKTSTEGRHISPMAAVFACAFAGAVVLALGLYLFGDKDRSNEAILVSGLWKISSGDPLARGRKMRVPVESGAKVVLEDGTTLWLGSSSEAVAEDPSFGEVKLSKGRLLASVAKREAPKSFRLSTPSGDIVVHGTVFSVDIDESGSSVRLYEGEIEVEMGDDSIVVSPGHQVRVSRGTILSMTKIDRAAVIADLMITEKTATLEGPPVPKIGVLDEEPKKPEIIAQVPIEASVVEEPLLQKKPKSKRVKPAKRGIVSSGDPIIEDTDTVESEKPEFTDPEVEAIIDEYTKDVSPDEDELFDKAYHELKAGHHKEAREILEEYVEVYPRARYWQHVKNILGE